MSNDTPVQGWIPWNGGICPVDPWDFVEYRLRYGNQEQFLALAGLLRWDHGRTPESAADASLRRNDIIAYRLRPNEPEPTP